MASLTVPKILPVLALAWTSLLATSAMAASVSNTPCNAEWEKTLKQFPKPDDRILEWSSLSEKCANSGIYESRLSTLYALAGLYDKARKVAEAGLALKTLYEKDLLGAIADADLAEQKFDRAFQQYEALIKAYPDWYDGYYGVGTIKLIQGKYEEAVRYLNEANRRDQQYAPTYRNLTLAYHKLGQHEETVKAINSAYQLNKGIVRDRDAMLSAARSYALLGKYKVADGFLKMLLEAKPEVVNDPEVARVRDFVAKKLKEAPKN